MTTANRMRSSRVDPASLYASPRALALDASLPRAVRIRLLRQWEATARAEERAASEGMETDRPSRLREVCTALALLEDSGQRSSVPEPDTGAANEHPSNAQPGAGGPYPEGARRRNAPALLLLAVLYASAVVVMVAADASAGVFVLATAAAAIAALVVVTAQARVG